MSLEATQMAAGRPAMGGLPQEQYRIHSSENPAARGIRYDPLRYGLKPTRYRVRHFGHSTQCRTRDIAMPYGDEGYTDCYSQSRPNNGRKQYPLDAIWT